MKLATPIILIVIAIALFFVYIDPTYSHIQALSAQAAQYDAALNNSTQLQNLRDKLLSKYNTFNASDTDRLQKLLPDTVDNVRLIMDIASIASHYNISVSNVTFQSSESATSTPGVIGPDQNPYGSLKVDFTVVSSYENFVQFLTDLQNSL